MNRILSAALACLLIPAALSAKVIPHHLVSDHMVLQQQASVRLWGTGDAGKTVRVSASWTDRTWSAKVGRDGKWEVKVDTPKASYEPQTVTFDDGEKLTVSDILIGEVWVAGGQSNMEMPVRGFDSCPVEGYLDVLAEAANPPAVRYAKIPSAMSMTPLEDVDCHWTVIDRSTVSWASATGYFFARMLSRQLDVPVGMIEANKGGSRVESWLSRENLAAHTNEPLEEKAIVEKYSQWDYHRPLVWGNATFHPIVNYTVKGILFYQGCSNVGDPAGQYAERLALMVRQWREEFGLGEIPFHYVQICPWGGDTGETPDGDWVARLREEQQKAVALIPNSAVICTDDCVYPYEINQIHPTQKRKVGERLAMLTLNRTYGQSWFPADSPTYKSMRIEGDKVFLTFDHMDGGTNRMWDIQGFEVAGEDRVFHPAVANHNRGRFYVSSPEVPQPVAVRYAFRNFAPGNYGNGLGLPLFPFRTDNW